MKMTKNRITIEIRHFQNSQYSQKMKRSLHIFNQWPKAISKVAKYQKMKDREQQRRAKI